MKKSGNHIKIIYAPRSLRIFLIQYMSLVPLGMILAILSVVFMLEASSNYKAILVLFPGFILLLLLIAFIMLYFPNQFRTRFIFDNDKNHLYKTKKRTNTETFDLSRVKSIVSKTIKTYPSCKYNLIFDEAENNFRIIIIEDTPFGTGHWETFSEKLSKITGLPLKKEFWSEDFNGKLSLVPHEEQITNKKRAWLLISIPIIVALLGAMVYKFYPSFEVFIFSGLITVLFNICLSFIYVFLNRDKFEDWANNHLILIISILTLLIPFSIFYLLFIFLLNGFRMP